MAYQFVPLRESQETQYPSYAGLNAGFQKIQFRCNLAIAEALANQTINWAQHSHFFPKDALPLTSTVDCDGRNRAAEDVQIVTTQAAQR